MTRPCSICRRVDAPQVDAALIDGHSFRDLARRFGASKSALHRHQFHIIRIVGEGEGDPDAVLDRLRRFDEQIDATVRGILEVSRYDGAEKG